MTLEIDLAYYSGLLADFVQDLPITSWYVGQAELRGSVLIKNLPTNPYIDVQPSIYREESLAEIITAIIENGLSLHYIFFDEQHQEIKSINLNDPSLKALNPGTKYSLLLLVAGKAIKILFTVNSKKRLSIRLSPEEPVKERVCHGGISTYDTAFYLECALNITNNFFIHSLYASGFSTPHAK